MMRIVHSRPPNWEQIVSAFPKVVRWRSVFFCYGDAIYNPDGVPVAPEIVAHEEVHSARQGNAPDLWWNEYIASTKFRFDEELVAHRAEYAHVMQHGVRQHRRRALKEIAERLAGPLYGGMVGLDEAKRLIAP